MVGTKFVVDACLSFISSCQFPNGLNDACIVLIPKNTNPIDVSQMRPIAFCNVIYKIVAKALANRMKVVLSDIILDKQSAFLPRRLLTDNV